jgi:hypothetical protein
MLEKEPTVSVALKPTGEIKTLALRRLLRALRPRSESSVATAGWGEAPAMPSTQEFIGYTRHHRGITIAMCDVHAAELHG